VTTHATQEVIDFGPIQVAFDGSVLRPRAWTLGQSEWAAELAASGDPLLEVGCGAGHIGLAAAVMSGSRLVQVDRDPAACRWAGLNAAAAGCADRVEQRCGTAAEVLAGGELFAVVIADPPYVPSDEVALYPEDPPAAIDGGPDGLEKVRTFLGDIAGHVAPGGSVLLQVRGAGQVAELDRWLALPASPPFVVTEARFYGDLRTVARLAYGSSAQRESNRTRSRDSSS
jgi:release factor glutamine methyltransferase